MSLVKSWTDSIKLVDAHAATLTTDNASDVKTALQAWSTKFTAVCTTSHKVLEHLLKTYKPTTEKVHAALILKNSNPRCMSVRAKFMGRVVITLEDVT